MFAAPVAIVLGTIVALSHGAAVPNARYAPDNSGRYNPLLYDGGKYYHDDSGRYVPDYSGLYHHDGLGYYANDGSGLYKDDGSGKYDRRKYHDPYQSNRGRYRSEPKYAKPFRKTKTIRSVDEAKEIDGDLLAIIGRYKHDVKPIVRRKIPRYDGHWKIIRQNGGVADTGYKYLYETENKILAEERAKVTNKGAADESIQSAGFYQYVGDDDKKYKLTYTADENGFIPQGDHLPLSIVRLLEYHRAHG